MEEENEWVFFTWFDFWGEELVVKFAFFWVRFKFWFGAKSDACEEDDGGEQVNERFHGGCGLVMI